MSLGQPLESMKTVAHMYRRLSSLRWTWPRGTLLSSGLLAESTAD
jgi:hypothetical protein